MNCQTPDYNQPLPKQLTPEEKQKKKKWKWIGIGLVAVLLILTWNTHRLEEKRLEEAKENGTVIYYLPELTVYDFEGKPHLISEYLEDGYPVVVNFWASWCEPCVKELSAFYAAQQKYGDSVRFVFVSICDGTQETVETAKKFIENIGFKFNYYYDDTGNVAQALSLKKVPATFFLYDKTGYVASGELGGLDEEMIVTGIEKAFDKIYGVENDNTVTEPGNK